MWPFIEPAASSDQVQALDLGIFGIQKVIKSSIRANLDITPQTDDIRRIYNSLQRAATPDNVVSAFRQAGIYVDQVNGEMVARADIAYARAVRGGEHEKYVQPEWMKQQIKLT